MVNIVTYQFNSFKSFHLKVCTFVLCESVFIFLRKKFMSFIKKIGNVLLGTSIFSNTGDQFTDDQADIIYAIGVKFLTQGKYEKALNNFCEASSLGHVSAKYNQALMRFNGLGDYPDFDLSKKLFTEAKLGGHTRCDDFLDFMDIIDNVMIAGNPNVSPQREIFSEQMQHAFMKIIVDVEKQAGETIYLVSKDILRKIANNHKLAKEFISNEIGAMHLGNETSIQYLKKIGKYNPKINCHNFENNFNEITTFLDYSVWPAILKSSLNTLSLDKLV